MNIKSTGSGCGIIYSPWLPKLIKRLKLDNTFYCKMSRHIKPDEFKIKTANLDKSRRKAKSTASGSEAELPRSTLELYLSFMQAYVKRINEASFNVTIGGVRIGSAKYSRLAQINLETRIITFSRFAIENVPERGRRYLVLHELAHVHEAGHNKHFWNLVGRYEPDFKTIGLQLDRAFKSNVQSHVQTKTRPKEAVVDRGAALKAAGLLQSASQNNLIWTPNHGYIEQGSKQLGLHQDPVDSFVRTIDNQLVEESFSAYLDLRAEENYGSDGCVFKEDDFEDESFGIISGGDF